MCVGEEFQDVTLHWSRDRQLLQSSWEKKSVNLCKINLSPSDAL